MTQTSSSFFSYFASYNNSRKLNNIAFSILKIKMTFLVVRALPKGSDMGPIEKLNSKVHTNFPQKYLKIDEIRRI